MRTRIFLAVVFTCLSCFVTSNSWGSLAARLQAAAAAQQQQQQQSAAAAAAQVAEVVSSAEGSRPAGVLNVADWLDELDGSRIGVTGETPPDDTVTPASNRRRATAKSPPRTDMPLLHAPLNDAADNDPSAGDPPTDPAPVVTEDDVRPTPAAETEKQPPLVELAVPAEAKEAPAAVTPKAAAPARQFSPQLVRVRDKVRNCLTHYYQRPERVEERSPWGLMHAMVAYGVDAEFLAGTQRVNAVGWLCYNRPGRGMTLMTVKDGRLMLRNNGPGFQGHDGQLLSLLALSGVPITYPMRAEGHEFTVADLVEYEQRMCTPKSELTFQMIGITHYCPSDATWQSDRGLAWSIPRLIQEELAQPVRGAACGGTHRLIALSTAVKTRQKRGEPMDGQWLRAEKFVTAYHGHAMKLQNRDGSFSTSWLERRDDSGALDRRVQTTGHILEWLVFSLPEKDLTDPRLVKSVDYLATLLLRRDREWEIGPRDHAIRALALYNERVFGDKPGERRELLARRPGK